MSDEPMRSRKRPDWATGLRQLYDSVVEEPLPDSFSDLLSKFDEEDPADAKDASTKPAGTKGAGA
ncbi:NepR family anti-sigma factor [Croceicoccus sp. Ery5]|uniref:NepR family anti-sigma factor n=1 Tax=Croceicoccus sp. Ery5 TaxID=1703340 RepID=UPI001E5C7B38|nr:NepR family anti-sigma factor [Croceicoccus sp. Ery5]